MHAIDDDDAIKTLVMADSVSAVAENKNWITILLGVIIGINDFGWSLDFDNEAGGTTELHRG